MVDGVHSVNFSPAGSNNLYIPRLLLSFNMAAYTFFMIVVLIVIAAVVIAFLNIGINMFSRQMNTDIVNGKISVQTRFAYDWNKTFLSYSLGIGLIGFAIFGVVRAIEVAEAGQGFL